VNPGVIHDVVMGTPGVIEYQAVVAHRDPEDELSQDRFVVRVAVEWSDAEGAGQALARRVKDATEVTPEIELVDDPNEIYDQRKDFKARRFVDARRNH